MHGRREREGLPATYLGTATRATSTWVPRTHLRPSLLESFLYQLALRAGHWDVSCYPANSLLSL